MVMSVVVSISVQTVLIYLDSRTYKPTVGLHNSPQQLYSQSVIQYLVITSFLYLASSLGFLLAFDMKKLMVMLSSQVSVMDWWRTGETQHTTTSWRSPDSEHQQDSPPLYIDKIISVYK